MEHHKPDHNRADPQSIYFDQDFQSREESTDNGGFSNHSGSLHLVEKSPAHELDLTPEQEFIYEDVVTIGADFIEASNGNVITIEQYRNLLDNNWAIYNIDEVLKLFKGNWGVFQKHSRSRFDELEVAKQVKRTILLAEIEEAYDMGELPFGLLNKIENRKDPVKPKTKTFKGRTYEVANQGYITTEFVSDEEKISRYTRYKVAKSALSNKPVSDLRIKSMVLGINLPENNSVYGMLASGYLSSVMEFHRSDGGSKSKISEEEKERILDIIRLSAQELELYEYFFPKERLEHLRSLMECSLARKNLFTEHEAMNFYQQDTNNTQTETSSEYFIDLQSRNIIVGADSLANYQHYASDKSSIKSLSDVLRDDTIPIPENKNDDETPIRYDKDMIIQFGKMLLSVLESPKNPLERRINETILRRAAKLGLGPSLRTIEANFGTKSQFYEAIGAPETHHEGYFDDWTPQQCIDHIRFVGEDLDRKPTIGDLWKFARDKPWLYPSPYKMSMILGYNGSSIGPAMELADYKEVKSWNEDDYLDWGVKFMFANDGKELTSHILNYLSKKGLGPTSRTIASNFGLNKFKEKVKQEYEERCSNHQLNPESNTAPRLDLRLDEDYETHRKKLERDSYLRRKDTRILNKKKKSN